MRVSALTTIRHIITNQCKAPKLTCQGLYPGVCLSRSSSCFLQHSTTVFVFLIRFDSSYNHKSWTNCYQENGHCRLRRWTSKNIIAVSCIIKGYIHIHIDRPAHAIAPFHFTTIEPVFRPWYSGFTAIFSCTWPFPSSEASRSSILSCSNRIFAACGAHWKTSSPG